MRIALFFCSFILFSQNSKAGYDLLFCAKTDSMGHCRESASEFKWEGDKMKLQLIILNKDKLGTTKLNFRVYSMKNDRNGTLEAELSTYTQPKWLHAVRSIYFFKPGYYKVDVFDADNKLLISGFVTIMDR